MNSTLFWISRSVCFLLTVMEARNSFRWEEIYWKSAFLIISCSQSCGFVCIILLTASDRVWTARQVLCALVVHRLHNSKLQSLQKNLILSVRWTVHIGRLSLWLFPESNSSVIEMSVKLVGNLSAHSSIDRKSFVDCIAIWHSGHENSTSVFSARRFRAFVFI